MKLGREETGERKTATAPFFPNHALIFPLGFTYVSFLLSEILEQVMKDAVPRALSKTGKKTYVNHDKVSFFVIISTKV